MEKPRKGVVDWAALVEAEGGSRTICTPQRPARAAVIDGSCADFRNLYVKVGRHTGGQYFVDPDLGGGARVLFPTPEGAVHHALAYLRDRYTTRLAPIMRARAALGREKGGELLDALGVAQVQLLQLTEAEWAKDHLQLAGDVRGALRSLLVAVELLAKSGDGQ